MTTRVENTGPLKGLRVFDMTRILAGPSATQILGDMGADILKIEKPQEGDDTRKWGPPYLKDKNGNDTTESAYYLSANRNKRSVTLDFAKPEGLELAKKLLKNCDILVENFKTGTLEKYGLGYDQIKNEFPGLIYCSLTGFGQSGPYKDLPGYDYLIQGMGGIMGLTGPADGAPHKIGVAYCDLLAGLYAVNGILGAVYHREKTGKGQFVDLALLDAQVATLSNAGQYYLTSGEVTPRMGNAHPTIVPYEAFMAKDGYIILAVGNDRQFEAFCDFAQMPELAKDPRFAKNADRVKNRKELVPAIREKIAAQPMQYWMDGLTAHGVSCGPVNTVDRVFTNEQVLARGMVTEMTHPLSQKALRLISSPLRFSDTPVSYRRAPPALGQDTEDVLTAELSMTPDDILTLRQKGVV